MKTPHKAAPRDHLEAVGKAIYGDAFKAPLSRALKVDLRTLQRWTSVASVASDLSWDHGAIADLRDILADEHAEALRDEAELRTALADLDDAILYQRLYVENGGREPVVYWDAWSELSGWQPDYRPSTLQDYAAEVGKLRGRLSMADKQIRDLENEIANLNKPKGMHFNISAG